MATRTTKATNKTLIKLQQQMAKLQVQADALRKKEVAGVIAKAKADIAHYGITAEELGFGRTPGAKTRVASSGPVAKSRKSAAKAAPRAAKYQDDQGNSWSGIGKRPNWFKTALESGKTAEDLLVKA